jgi:hypothetical protein
MPVARGDPASRGKTMAESTRWDSWLCAHSICFVSSDNVKDLPMLTQENQTVVVRTLQRPVCGYSFCCVGDTGAELWKFSDIRARVRIPRHAHDALSVLQAEIAALVKSAKWHLGEWVMDRDGALVFDLKVRRARVAV